MNQIFEQIVSAINPNNAPVIEMKAIYCNIHIFREDGTSSKRVTAGDRLTVIDGELQQISREPNVEVIKCYGRTNDTDFSIVVKSLQNGEESTIKL